MVYAQEQIVSMEHVTHEDSAPLLMEERHQEVAPVVLESAALVNKLSCIYKHVVLRYVYFTVQLTCGNTTSSNNTYFTNPGFPSSYAGGTSCTLTIQKCNPWICQVFIPH